MSGVGSPQFRRVAGADTDIPGIEGLHAHLAARDDPHSRGGGGRELVEAVVTAEHQPSRPARGENPGDDRREPRIGDADGLGRGAARVAQRPKNIENRGHAEFAPGPGGVSHGRVEDRREAERGAGLGEAGADTGRRQIDDNAEFGQQIGRSAGG